jgi:hypothetical protein
MNGLINRRSCKAPARGTGLAEGGYRQGCLASAERAIGVSQLRAFWAFLRGGRAAAPSAPAVSPVRDARIDVIRGLALLVIFINHMPGNIVSGVMPHNFGFSDAADIFVLLAGVSATLAYGRLIESRGYSVGLLTLGGRLWTLYIAHLAVFILVCGIVSAAVTRTQNPLYVEAINIQPFFNDTFAALLDALMLTYQPNFLDILPLYIALLAGFPVIYLAARRSPLLTVAASLGLWQAALAFGWNFPNARNSGWYFNPFAWQVIFTLGVVIGRAAQQRVTLPALRLIDAAAIAFLAFSLVVKTASGNPFGLPAMNEWLEALQLGSDKTNLAWARVLHIGSLAWLAIRFLPAGGALASSAVGRVLSRTGQHPLEVFCAGIVLSIAGQIVLAETAFDTTVQLLVCAIGVMLLAGLGNFLSWYQSLTRTAAARPAAPLAGAAASRASSALPPR